ncbi:unnamed protein product [Cylindrotheca closterium]|uniref:Uncharacterized protein n=1 Tax=Cylindrotheca closterium TaxID=2856 RepID=A0AAD2JM54_9STRA|nr:unnamed protein product [Cylindrotheca closterium]
MPPGQNITYNHYTINTAVLAPTKESLEIKQAILQQSVNSIKQTKTTMEHRVDFLMERYTSVCPDICSRFNTTTSKLFDVTSDVNEFTSLHVINKMGQAIAMGFPPPVYDDEDGIANVLVMREMIAAGYPITMDTDADNAFIVHCDGNRKM